MWMCLQEQRKQWQKTGTLEWFSNFQNLTTQRKVLWFTKAVIWLIFMHFPMVSKENADKIILGLPKSKHLSKWCFFPFFFFSPWVLIKAEKSSKHTWKKEQGQDNFELTAHDFFYIRHAWQTLIKFPPAPLWSDGGNMYRWVNWGPGNEKESPRTHEGRCGIGRDPQRGPPCLWWGQM